MKLRIRGNSIRLRLGASEITRLSMEGRVSESTQFASTPGSQLTYVVAISPEVKDITAGFCDGILALKVPESMGREWLDSSLVSLRGEQKVGDGTTLSILLEKDFRCLDPRPGEDESDAYPNPAQHPTCDPQ